MGWTRRSFVFNLGSFHENLLFFHSLCDSFVVVTREIDGEKRRQRFGRYRMAWYRLEKLQGGFQRERERIRVRNSERCRLLFLELCLFERQVRSQVFTDFYYDWYLDSGAFLVKGFYGPVTMVTGLSK